MNQFDIKSQTWDMNAMHMDRSKAIAGELEKMIPLDKRMKVLEYGAGTGLLSFLLQDRFAELTLLDSSQKMVEICKEKIAASGAKHMKTLLMDLEHEDLHEHFDLIYSQMVFHHVVGVEPMIAKFSGMLTPGGYLAIADLYPEDGSFHGLDVHDVHRGFDVELLSSQLVSAGFKNIRRTKAFVVKRGNTDGTVAEYPVFLMVGQR